MDGNLVVSVEGKLNFPKCLDLNLNISGATRLRQGNEGESATSNSDQNFHILTPVRVGYIVDAGANPVEFVFVRHDQVCCHFGMLSFSTSVGAIFAYSKREQYQGLLPPYIVMLDAAGRFSEEGFLGPAYKPFATGGDPNADRFEVQGIVNRGINDDRQRARRDLVDKVNLMGYGLADAPAMAEAEAAKQKAYGLILGRGKEVFDLANEPTELRDRYGRNTFGQECLAARRMVEAGVPYVNISFPGGWDTHGNHFATMKRQCPWLDQGVATLLEDLKQRGLLDTTLVWCTGEFGRTPKVSWEAPWNGGRHHHGAVFTVLVAGGGFKGGCVVGSSDEKGEKVKDRPVYPADLLGTFYLLAGIDAAAKLPHPLGFDARVLDTENEGMKAAGLLEELI